MTTARQRHLPTRRQAGKPGISTVRVEISAAIVDRLTFAGQIIETGTTSYRLAHARHARTGGASSNRHAGAKSG
jgi:hypothetical protein